MVNTYNFIMLVVFVAILIPFFIGITKDAKSILKEREDKINKRNAAKEKINSLVANARAQQKEQVTEAKKLREDLRQPVKIIRGLPEQA